MTPRSYFDFALYTLITLDTTHSAGGKCYLLAIGSSRNIPYDIVRVENSFPSAVFASLETRKRI